MKAWLFFSGSFILVVGGSCGITFGDYHIVYNNDHFGKVLDSNKNLVTGHEKVLKEDTRPLITHQRDEKPGYHQVNNFVLSAAATDEDVQIPLERTTMRSLRIITEAKSRWDDAESKLKFEAPKCVNCQGHLLSNGYIADSSIANQLKEKETMYTSKYKE